MRASRAAQTPRSSRPIARPNSPAIARSRSFVELHGQRPHEQASGRRAARPRRDSGPPRPAGAGAKAARSAGSAAGGSRRRRRAPRRAARARAGRKTGRGSAAACSSQALACAAIAGGVGGARGPVEALGAGLRRARGAAVELEQPRRVGGPVEPEQSGRCRRARRGSYNRRARHRAGR